MVKSSNKTAVLTTEVFNGKQVPPFIKDHSLFRKPTKIEKVFPSIGMPNFKEKANIDKCFIDIKKEGTYVHKLLKVMTDMVVSARDNISVQGDKLQFLQDKEARAQSKAKVTELYSLASIFSLLAEVVDPYNKEVLDKAIQVNDGKIVLKLIKDISDSTGKQVFRNGESLFKVFNKIKDKCTEYNLNFQALDQTEEFKIFSKENIPNKEFSIIFSSDGQEGAWDLLTMSMRGIKSCQRWDGEYPLCLIGSILSKFVGIMYLTSGVDHQSYGSKMMRRCVVRYGIDADERKPCILIDKMYPELDEDVLNVFTNAISSKTQLPVYYAPKLANKLRHIYIPSEKIRMEILNREWSYQDNPLKSRDDIDIHILNTMKDEVEREVKGFKLNFGLFLARQFEKIYAGVKHIESDEISKIINNIRMNTSFTPFCEQVANTIISNYKGPPSRSFKDSKSYYKKYLMQLLLQRKILMKTVATGLANVYTQFSSRKIDDALVNEFVFSLLANFTKSEIKNLIN